MPRVLTPLPTDAARAAAVLLAAASRGVQVFLEDDRLLVRPPHGLTLEERTLLRSMREQSAVIAHELRWRVEAMHRQVPRSPAPIPALLARLDVHRQPGVCLSCGESVLEASGARCPLCALAAWIALAAYEAPPMRDA